MWQVLPDRATHQASLTQAHLPIHCPTAARVPPLEGDTDLSVHVTLLLKTPKTFTAPG